MRSRRSRPEIIIQKRWNLSLKVWLFLYIWLIKNKYTYYNEYIYICICRLIYVYNCHTYDLCAVASGPPTSHIFDLRWYLGKTLQQLQSLESIFDRLGAPKLLEYIMVQWKMAGHLKGNYVLEMSTHFFTKNPWLWEEKGMHISWTDLIGFTFSIIIKKHPGCTTSFVGRKL